MTTLAKPSGALDSLLQLITGKDGAKALSAPVTSAVHPLDQLTPDEITGMPVYCSLKLLQYHCHVVSFHKTTPQSLPRS